MSSLFRLFWKICLLKAGPQDLPGSSFLAGLTTVATLFSGTLVVLQSYGVLWSAFLMQLMDVLIVAAAIKTGLEISKKPERFYQSVSALFGTGVIVNLLSLPLLAMLPEPGSTGGAGIWGLLYLMLILWALTIMAHIVRHTFEIPFALGVVAAVGYFLLINSLVQAFFLPGVT